MADLPSRSELPKRLTRTELDKWLTERGDNFADVIARELKAITTETYGEFLASLPPQESIKPVQASLTAAGDIKILDLIIGRWRMVLPQVIMPAIEETYLLGGVSAFTQSPGSKKLPASRVAGWADVVNEQAVEYMSAAFNRMVGVGETVWNDISSRTAKAIATGATNEELKIEIERLGQFSEYRADTIARTETNAAYINGDWAGAQALGEFGPTEKVWVATFDRRTRETHAEISDTVMLMDEPFDVGGEPMMYPHDPNASAAEVVNCRCYLELLYPGDTRPDGSVVPEPDTILDSPEIPSE